jgi:hypothetical protein
VDVSETAREAGIKFPLALTRAVWAADALALLDGCPGPRPEDDASPEGGGSAR